MDPEEDAQLSGGFRFILYVSFPKQEEAIAFDMCQGLQELCQKKNIKNFEFHPRFSNQSKERWDQTFIENCLNQYSSENLKKIWVCGPPSMNETFDRYLTERAGKADKANKFVFEIL